MNEKMKVVQSVELRAKVKGGTKVCNFEDISQVVMNKKITNIILVNGTQTALGENLYVVNDAFITLRKGKNPIFDKVPLSLFNFIQYGILFEHINRGRGIEWDKSIIDFAQNVPVPNDGEVILFQVFYEDLPVK